MSTIRWLCVPVASLALLGCGTMREHSATGCTPGGVCKVAVTIEKCMITASPDRLVVPEPRGLKKIVWYIATDGYVFAADGIVITEPGGEFEQRELSAKGNKFKWNDKHTRAGNYKYVINVVQTGVDPRNCPPKDPWISNQ